MERGTLKTRMIFIATRGKTSLYRAYEDVPPGLRQKLFKTTKGANAGTVLIADRRGLQELVRAGVRRRNAARRKAERRGEILIQFAHAHWPELGLAGALSMLLFLALFFR